MQEERGVEPPPAHLSLPLGEGGIHSPAQCSPSPRTPRRSTPAKGQPLYTSPSLYQTPATPDLSKSIKPDPSTPFKTPTLSQPLVTSPSLYLSPIPTSPVSTSPVDSQLTQNCRFDIYRPLTEKQPLSRIRKITPKSAGELAVDFRTPEKPAQSRKRNYPFETPLSRKRNHVASPVAPEKKETLAQKIPSCKTESKEHNKQNKENKENKENKKEVTKEIAKGRNSIKVEQETVIRTGKWTKEEISLLIRAWEEIPSNLPMFWETVAQVVVGRTAAQCRDQYDKLFGEVKEKKKKKVTSQKKRYSPINGKVNFKTAKARRKIRHLMEQNKKGSGCADAFECSGVEEVEDSFKTPEKWHALFKKTQKANQFDIEPEIDFNEDGDKHKLFTESEDLDIYDVYKSRFTQIRCKKEKRTQRPRKPKLNAPMNKKALQKHNQESKELVSKLSHLLQTKKTEDFEKEDLEADGQTQDYYEDIEENSNPLPIIEPF
eukprot:TRINITY_DN12551_c0_g1_i1.p1 TRINITY_DN12551_c0_g1~~TRINITY_DN12551_c0_g1_i1.p1  ORF type:complete len:502 (+),score=137.58 TRINITY_DN12551_c0_g1_i1:44-1507(+)